MSELRWDPLKQHWVIIATERGRRPRDFMVEHKATDAACCPFCYGLEEKTPPEIYAVRDTGAANSPGWMVRVIPNKYPALRIEGDLNSRGFGPYDVLNGIGAHEIIIETPDHDRDMAELSPAEITEVLRAWRARFLDLRRDTRFRYMVLFKNHGTKAGATLSHSHSQLIAVPLIPPVAATELRVCKDYFSAKERCLICDLIDFELKSGERIVREFANYVIMTPYAACFPFEVRLYPKRHAFDFALLPDAELTELAVALKDMLTRLRSILRDPPYNFILHTAPPRHPRLGKPGYWSSIEYDYHWHIELVPRLTQIAGFEWGTGFHINPTSPEDAATFLREAGS
ncbi:MULTISPECIES: galactose-1-phosphate uridylyltransferase [Geobacter]|uniref:Galactose-1-phosphate uridylyltransferase n=2 Tax=Geobacter TaxID=28231 RepID=A0A0C1TVY3_9BACT|nr:MULTISPECIES: galactose-1-phosphate uridylyltransferase [Geobacter]ANA41371.1 galactose-1-phosphate uridylyltransferase [Geobacter anodireducens]KIE43543.1 galactose-1-phosphate uridylyltransferase [Geobacter soli]MBE2888815.1 galactose-1-phosphate uridylyltransferase [Geobacter anodireducens]HMN02064.1 galactose-1-phosphate uridylyltransferase [Geobacter anodireducens]